MLILLPLALLVGCEYGKVDQGRVVAYDKTNNTCTIITDQKADPANPDYSHLPAVTYKLPVEKMDMGPEPKAGGRMKLDVKERKIVIYDPETKGFKDIEITITGQRENVEKKDPLVYDEAADKAKKFPLVDRDKKTVTIYSGRQKLLVTFSMAPENFSYPDSTWDAGDEARIYYKETGKALRFMNITKTDIFKK